MEGAQTFGAFQSPAVPCGLARVERQGKGGDPERFPSRGPADQGPAEPSVAHAAGGWLHVPAEPPAATLPGDGCEVQQNLWRLRAAGGWLRGPAEPSAAHATGG